MTRQAEQVAHKDLVSEKGTSLHDHPRGVTIAPFESDAGLSVGDGKIAFTVPVFMGGMNLVDAIASVHTAGLTGSTDIQLRRRRAGNDVDLLSTKITIGDEFYASDGIIDTGNSEMNEGDQIYVDVDQIHSGTVPKGLSVSLEFRSS